jgi:ADP-heptose:LPS heptosyltransferase
MTRLKDVERGFKAFAIRSLGGVMGGQGERGNTPAAIDWAKGPHRVLYLRYDRIGDMVLATGIIRAIKAAQPTVTIDVLASPANARVLAGNPHVDRVLTFDKRRRSSYLATVMAMRRGRYDAVIDAMVMAPSLTTMLLMWASGAKHRIGVSDRGNEYALTIPVARLPGAVHYVDHSAALLAAFGGDVRRLQAAGEKVELQTVERRLPGASRTEGEGEGEGGGEGQGSDGFVVEAPSSGWDIWRPEIFLTAAEGAAAQGEWQRVAVGGGAGARARGEAPEDGERDSRGLRLVVNVSAGAPGRYWPESRFIAAIERLSARFPGMRTLVVGSPEDAERTMRIASASGERTGAATTPDYRQMMALVATADAALTADTSVTHIASAFGTPAVVMCARGLAPLYGPYGTTGRTVSTEGRTLESLELEPVVAALETVIADAGSRARAPDRVVSFLG